MIHSDDVEQLKDFFGLVLINGLHLNFTLPVIEEKITKSSFFINLENGKLSFNKTNLNNVIADVLSVNTNDVDSCYFDSTCFWLGEFYISLFIRYKKSFSFLFTYFPLDEGFKIFKLYHEMANEEFFHLYESEINKTSLLTKLLEKNNLTLDQLSILTGINKNSLMKYAQSNNYLYGAGLDNILKLSFIFEVGVNIFAETLLIYTNSERFKFDKSNPVYRTHLAYNFLCYFNRSIRIGGFSYNEKKNQYTNKDGEIIKVTWLENQLPYFTFDPTKNGEIIKYIQELNAKEVSKEKTILVIFEFSGASSSVIPYLNIPFAFKNVFIINQSFFLDLRKGKQYEIPYKVNEALINRSKSLMKYDFAFYDH